jgi:eukaryotic-like serine/threonine-protein kinase
MSARYERIRKLGAGGMGSVYLVWDGERQRAVAQKRILEPGASTLLRFKREFREVERLRHPNLVRLLELGSDEDGLFITMEVLDGVELREYFGWERSGRGARATGPPGPTTDDSHAATVFDDGSASSTPEVRSGERYDSGDESNLPSAVPGGIAPALITERLAHVLPQLIEALSFLHGNNVVHRDLKPANVMVTRDGVVKLLDFGVLARLGLDLAEGGGESDLSGTPGYMAPEQIRGDPPSPANDLYALGAILYELVSGRHVFAGAPMALLLQHMEEEPPHLTTASSWVPAPVADACHLLLRKEPGDRPTLKVLARTLLPALGARAAIFGAPRPLVPALVGRQSLQAVLRRRVERGREGDFSFVALTGPTGAGKSALAEWLGEEMAGVGVCVLRGRGRSSERVPFNALDGVIDDLALLLGQLHRRRVDRSLVLSMTTASAAFPVLRPRRPAGASGGEGNRRAAFSAVASLLAHSAKSRGGLLILVDDLQWADGDSVALLDHLVSTGPAAVAVVATLRDDVGENAALRWLAQRKEVERLFVEPLGDEALEQIVRREARLAGAEPGDHEVREAAAACRGRPFFAELAGRDLGRDPLRGARSLGTSIRGLLEETGPLAREVLALVVAVDTWTDESLVVEALDRPRGEVSDELADLARAALIRRAGVEGPGGRVDVYHDAVRTTLVAVLGEDALAAAHGRLFEVLQGRDTPPERLVRHLLGAGQEVQAAGLARQAAIRAEEQQAFGLAAEMYSVALLHPGEHRAALLRGRASALGSAARFRESAEVWREVGQHVEGDEALDAALREAHALLSANDIAGGHDRLNRALVEAGEPPVDAGVARKLAGLAFLAGPPEPTGYVSRGLELGRIIGARLGLERTPEPDVSVRKKGERDIQIGMLVAHYDPLSGIRFLRRAQSRLVRAGAAEQAAYCDYLFSYLALFGAAKAGPVPLAQRYLASATRHMEGIEATLVMVRASPRFLRGVEAIRAGDSDSAVRDFTFAERLFAEAGMAGSYEHMRMVYQLTMAAYFKADLPALEAHLTRWRAASADADNLATRSNRAVLEQFHRIHVGRFDEARQRIGEVVAAYPPDYMNLQRAALAFVSNWPDVYDQDCRAARRRIETLAPLQHSFRGMTDMYASIYAGIAAMVEANALRSGDPGASRITVHLYSSIARAAPPLRISWAIRAEAYAADAAGEPEVALARLQEAQTIAARYDQPMEVAVSRFQRGLRLGGDQGRALQARAIATARGLDASERLLHEDFGMR